MTATPPDSGFRTVKPKRKQKRTPSRLAREARRLAERTNEARDERQASWTEGGQPEFAAERQEIELGRLHAQKRGLRREVYSVAPELEGRPFYNARPGGS